MRFFSLDDGNSSATDQENGNSLVLRVSCSEKQGSTLFLLVDASKFVIRVIRRSSMAVSPDEQALPVRSCLENEAVLRSLGWCPLDSSLPSAHKTEEWELTETVSSFHNEALPHSLAF